MLLEVPLLALVAPDDEAVLAVAAVVAVVLDAAVVSVLLPVPAVDAVDVVDAGVCTACTKACSKLANTVTPCGALLPLALLEVLPPLWQRE